MNTTKEKAKELVEKYAIWCWNETVCNYEVAKQCALIAVDEIISQWEYIDTYLADGCGELNPNLKYWYEVKSEIQKL